jgi:hypothetical protein
MHADRVYPSRMGVKDRDWYQDKARELEARQRPRSTRRSPRRRSTWKVALVWLVVFAVVYLVIAAGLRAWHAPRLRPIRGAAATVPVPNTEFFSVRTASRGRFERRA